MKPLPPTETNLTRTLPDLTSMAHAMRELRRLPRARWLDLIRNDQSHRWRRGSGPLVEDYFLGLPEIRDDTEEAVVLICGEIQLRREIGESPDVGEYEHRFPEFADRIALQFHVDEFLASPMTVAEIDSTDDLEDLDLPGYEFLERLGSGASGVVYRACQQGLGRFVAIKVLPSAAADAKQLARQRQEAEILARLQHPGVVQIYEVREFRGCLHLVMEFVDGTTLADRVRDRPLAPAESARLMVTLADTVHAVHEAGILHRDLKPSNILLTTDEQLKIADFGLAKLRSSGNQLTTADSVLGTPSYMAPEQAVGAAHTAGPQADVYSLGAILYELITGRAPFLGATVLDTLALIRTQEPVAPVQLQPSLPRDLETICLHCLNKSPQNRYPSAQALADDLRRFLDGAPILARRSTVAERSLRWCRRNPQVAALAGTVAVLLIAAVTILAVSNAGIRREAAAKDAALVTARQAVQQMLARVANEKLSHVPLAHPLREALLHDAQGFYEGFLAQANQDAQLGQEMASLLNQLAIIQRELGRFDDATRSLGRSIELLDSLVAADAHPPALREQLVAAHEALAYTWQINPAELGARQADRQYRQALAMYQDLERDWPNRRQPVGLCLRRLGELAFQRGDIAEAEQYWRQAIASGEAYLREQPGNIDARATLCWTCIGLCDLMLAPAQNRPEAAASILATGLAHAAIILQANPRSTSGREVAAFLRFRLAQCYCRTGKPDEAIGLFHEAIGETESLCVEFPWNGPHWDNAIYIHREVISSLKRADRGADAHRATRQMVDWLKRIAPALPDEPAPQAELLRCRDALVAILRSAGQDQEAKELEATVQPTKLPAGASPGK